MSSFNFWSIGAGKGNLPALLHTPDIWRRRFRQCLQFQQKRLIRVAKINDNSRILQRDFVLRPVLEEEAYLKHRSQYICIAPHQVLGLGSIHLGFGIYRKPLEVPLRFKLQRRASSYLLKLRAFPMWTNFS